MNKNFFLLFLFIFFNFYKITYSQVFDFNIDGICINSISRFNINNEEIIDNILWNFGDINSSENFSTEKNPTHTYKNYGEFLIEVEIFYNDTMSEILQKTILIYNLPEINLPLDTAVCENETITLNAFYENATYYLWEDGTNLPYFTTDKIGNTWVEVTDINSCKAFININIFLAKKPEVFIGDDRTLCANHYNITTNMEFDSYLWSNGETSRSIEIYNSGEYFAIVKNKYCYNSDTINLNLKAVPKIEKIDISINKEIHIKASGGMGILKYSINNIDFQESPFFYNLEYGDYYVFVKGENDCQISSNNFKIIDSDISVKIPSAFTPNDDGINDIWKIEFIGFYPEAEIKIFDRFGKLLVRYKGDYTGWNGNYHGKKMPSGTYWYIINIKDKTKIRNGSVTLIR